MTYCRIEIARAELYACFIPTEKKTGRSTISILSDFFPPRAFQARVACCQFFETCGIKQMKIERVCATGAFWAPVFFTFRNRTFLIVSSIFSSPSRICNEVEVLKTKDALCITQKSFNKRSQVSFSEIKKSFQ